MKHAALILTALLALTACQNKKETSTTTETTQTQEKSETNTASSETTAAEKTTEGPAETGTAEAASETAVSAPGALPTGYTLVPALSETPTREFKAEPDPALEDGKDYYALIDTSRGQVLVDLYEQETPMTVNNFVFLARQRFYDGIRFHRVMDGFMAQSGDPKSADEAKKAEWGTGDPGYKFADEFRTRLTFDSAGILAMANSGPATNGSQFFITFGPTESLNGRHTIFGKVVTGEDVLPKLTRTSAADPASGQEAPIEGAVADQVLSVRILTKG